LPSLEFSQVYSYAGREESIVVPVLLSVGEKRVGLAASIDTGASYCLFSAEIADALGLVLERVLPMRFRTANSQFQAFGHEVDVSVLGIGTRSAVYFFADPAIDKNVLGRTGWLDRVYLGLAHHESKVFLTGGG